MDRARGWDGREHAVVRGSAHAHASLDEARAAEIKRRIAAGEKDAALAAEYGVRPSTVWNIRRGRTWGHVPWPEGCAPPETGEGKR